MDKVKSILAAVAPGVAAALGGPFAGMATKFLADKFTDGDEAKVEDFVLSASPEHLAEIKKAGIELEETMAKLGVDLFEAEVADRQSAREMASELQWSSPQVGIAMVFLAGYIGLVFSFMSGTVKVDESIRGEFAVLLGVITAAVPQILAWFYGSTSGSSLKNKLLAKIN
jgi:hypothetical protein